MNPASGNAQALPFPQTNAEFLEIVFGPDWEYSLVCAKEMVRKHEGWTAGYAKDRLHWCTEKTNNYFSLSLFRENRRRAAEWLALYALVVDDVGTKLRGDEVERVLGKPDWIVRTSVSKEGLVNHQWGYRLMDPVEDQRVAWALSARVQLALPGGDRMDPTHFVRLPYGRHRKEDNEARQPGGWETKLMHFECSPKSFWTPAALNTALDELGIGQAKVPTHLGQGVKGPVLNEEDDPLFRALDDLGLVLGEHQGATSLGPGKTWDVRCPWSHEHTERVDEGAAYGIGGGFKCQHGHCAEKTMDQFTARLNEMLLEQSGGVRGLGSLHFDEVKTEDVDPLAGGAADDALPDRTENGAAKEFVRRHGVGLKYNHSTGRWHIWARDYWHVDETENVRAWIIQLAMTEYMETRALQKASAIAGIERLARADQRVAVTHEIWDRIRLRVGVPGGEVYLRTGALEPPNPGHMITRTLLVPPAPTGTPTPVWDRFLREAMDADQELVDFIHTWFGYCLSGDTRWEAFAFLYGTGGNGKTTVTSVMSAIFQGYARQASVETFMQRTHPAHQTEIARLAGARLVLANEVGEHSMFNMVRLKEHSDSGAKITAHFMRQDPFEFTPTHKLTFSGNHKPRLTSVDNAIKRRLLLIPFLFTPKQPDPTLKDQLVAEYPGILRKLIDAGVKAHHALDAGAMPDVPEAVRMATREYFQDEDVLERWLAEACVLDPDAEVGVTEAYNAHQTWCCAEGVAAFYKPRKFAGAIVERRIQCSVVHTKGGNVIKGLRLG